MYLPMIGRINCKLLSSTVIWHKQPISDHRKGTNSNYYRSVGKQEQKSRWRRQRNCEKEQRKKNIKMAWKRWRRKISANRPALWSGERASRRTWAEVEESEQGSFFRASRRTWAEVGGGEVRGGEVGAAAVLLSPLRVRERQRAGVLCCCVRGWGFRARAKAKIEIFWFPSSSFPIPLQNMWNIFQFFKFY